MIAPFELALGEGAPVAEDADPGTAVVVDEATDVELVTVVGGYVPAGRSGGLHAVSHVLAKSFRRVKDHSAIWRTSILTEDRFQPR